MQILEQRGPDSADFLHRITTANIKAMPQAQWVPSCILNPQGKIRSAFWVLKQSPDTFLLLLDTDHPEPATETLLATLEEFKFAERFEIRKLTSEESQTALNAAPAPLLPEAQRIPALQPRLGHELSGETNPLDAGAFAWVASNKGCYPGQEVIEKIISIGSPSRNLCLLEFTAGTRPPTQGEVVLMDTTTVGTITSVAPEVHLALGIIRKTQTELGTRLTTASGTTVVVKKKAAHL